MWQSRLLIVLAALCSSPQALPAEGSVPSLQAQVLRIPRVSRPPTIEDFLQGRPREAEAQVSDFRQYAPADGAPATRETTAYLSYDNTKLYVVFVCKDAPSQVRAHETRRDDIESEDRVAVYLDTFHDHRHAYIFVVNPLGVQADGVWTEGQAYDATFDTVWYSDGRLVADGFIAWMAIPFRSLRFPATPVQQWGLAVGRVIPRNAEISHWPFLTQRLESVASQLATLEGLERIAGGRNLQLIPYAASSRARFLDRAASGGAVLRSEARLRAGLDAKAVVRDAITVDVTVNPDFSQVESDEPQVTTNQRFEVFFPEKRPFFMENAGYFQTPTNVFFSRRIRDPGTGARLTGKRDAWSFGATVTDDRSGGRSGSAGEDQRAVIGAGRLQREFRNQSTVGLLLTGRWSGSSSNEVVSVDTRLKIGPNWVLSGQAIGSSVSPTGGGRLTGAAYWAEMMRSGRHLVYATRYTDRSPRFRSDLGFVPRVDIRQMEQYVRYYWRPEAGRVLAIGPDLTFQWNWNYLGQLQDRVVDVSFGTDLRGPTNFGCRHVNAYELFQNIGFRRHNTDCGAGTAWLKWLELKADYGWGAGVNYVPGPGLAPFMAASTNASFAMSVRPSARARVSQTYLFSRLSTWDSSPVRRPARARVFDDHILRTKVTYQLTRAMSLRGIVDYHATLPDTVLVALEHSKRLAADVLLTYMANPGTAVYVGYTDTYENIEVGPPWRFRAGGSASVSTGRQLFVKLGYLLRF